MTVSIGQRTMLAAATLLAASCGGSVRAQPTRPSGGNVASNPSSTQQSRNQASPPAQPTPSPPARRLTPLDEAANENELGKEALFAGKNDVAIAHLEQAYRLDPLDPRFTINLMLAYESAGRYGDSIAFARRVMTMPGATPRMLLIAAVRSGDSLGLCLAQNQSRCGREPVLTESEVERLDQQGQQLVSAHRSDEALPIFLRAYAYSGNPRPLLRIATFEYVTGFYPDAREHALHTRQLLAKRPSKLDAEVDSLIKAIEIECNKFTDPKECGAVRR